MIWDFKAHILLNVRLRDWCPMKVSKLGLVILILVMQCSNILASPQASSSTEFIEGTIDLTPYSEILVDSDHKQSIYSIQQDATAHLFKPTQEIGNNFGFSNSTYWVKFTIKQSTRQKDPVLLQFANSLIDKITLYLPDGSGGFSIKQTGDHVAFSQRDIAYRNFLFKLPMHQGEERTYYLQLQTEGSMQITLSLWTYKAFIEYVETENLILGFYYGIMFLLMVSAFAFYLKIKDRLFLHYSLYLLSYIIFQLCLNGLSYHYFWPGHPILTSQLTAVSVGLVTIGGIAFSGSFLRIWNTKKSTFFYVFMLVIVLTCIGIASSLLGGYSFGVRLLALTGISLPPIVLIAGISSVIQGYRPAKYFLAAWVIFLCGIFLAGLLFLGFVPHSFITVYAIQLGSTIEVSLLGYALMDRISLLKAEKQMATQLATAYLQRSNKELENLVLKRTQELEEKNKKLNHLTLIDSMTSLLTHNASIELLKKQLSFAQRYKEKLSVIMLDIDKFKSINDVYGHPAGDQVIIGIAEILKPSFREADYCGRYGGEEFIIILPKTSSSAAIELAERIRSQVLDLSVQEIKNTRITASFGVSSFNIAKPDEDLIITADKALYDAKKSGRNNVKFLSSL